MNYYETLYIVHPALESGHLKDIILSIEESLKNMGGKSLSIDLWGKKRLAYLIDKQKYGTYIQLQFSGEGKCTSSFGMELEHNPNILAYLTTTIDEADVVVQKEDLETQIVGQSRESLRIEEEDVKKEKGNASSTKIVADDSVADTGGDNKPQENSVDEKINQENTDEISEETEGDITDTGGDNKPQENSVDEKINQENTDEIPVESEKE